MHCGDHRVMIPKSLRRCWYIGKDDPWQIAACTGVSIGFAAPVLAALHTGMPTRYFLACGFASALVLVSKYVRVARLCRTGIYAEAEVQTVTNQCRGTGVVHYRFNVNGETFSGRRELSIESRSLMVIYNQRDPEHHIAFWDPGRDKLD